MGKLKAGVGRAVITPKIGTLLQGYAPMLPSTEVLDDLTVTALALEQDETRTLLLSISTTNIDEPRVELIRNAVSEVTGYAPLDITVAPWQIHTGPSTEFVAGWSDVDWDYCNDILFPGCVKAAADAVGDLAETLVGIGTARSDVGINRREVAENGDLLLGQNPYGPYDPTMTVIRFLRDGQPYANIVHYGAHPTALGNITSISRDWPGVMVDTLETRCGGMTLYLQGAVGDVGPRLTNGGTTGSIQLMQELGHRAGFHAVEACRSIKEYRELELELVYGDVRIPYQPLADADTARMKLVEYAAWKDKPGLEGAEYAYWQMVLEEHSKGSVRTHSLYRQTVTRLGPAVLVPFPGEVFAEIVLRMRIYSPFPYTLSIGDANGDVGYLVTRSAFPYGGYEVEVAKAFGAYLLAKDLDDIMIADNLKLLRSMK